VHLHLAVFSAFITIIAFATFADANTSSVSIQPETPYTGATAPLPAEPLDVLDTDYPLESLLDSEEGTVTLKVVINAEGHVVAAQSITGSGSARLDQAAVKVAMSRWLFSPATRGGQAVTGSLQADVMWKSPLLPVKDFDMEVTRLPAGSASPVAISSHDVRADDYPAVSIRMKEQGTVVLRYEIKEDGNVGDLQIVRSSGFTRLDYAASNFVKTRWKFMPALADGKPLSVWQAAIVSFQVSPGGVEKPVCDERPIGAEEVVLIRGALIRGSVPGRATLPPPSLPVARWRSIGSNGEVTDVLLVTKQGLRRPSAQLIPLFSKDAGNPVPNNKSPCWYYDMVAVPRR
jgi:TonB family protein